MKLALAVLVTRELTNHQIATRLAISEYTAATHVAKIFKKFGFHSRVQVASLVGRQQPHRPGQG